MKEYTMLKRFKKLKSKTKDNMINFLKEEASKTLSILISEDDDLKIKTSIEMLEFYVYFRERGFLNRVEEYLDDEDVLKFIDLGDFLYQQRLESIIDNTIEKTKNITSESLQKNAKELADKIWSLNKAIDLSFYDENMEESRIYIRSGIFSEELEQKMLYMDTLLAFLNDGIISGIFDENNIVKYFAISVINGVWANMPDGIDDGEEILGAECVRIEKES